MAEREGAKAGPRSPGLRQLGLRLLVGAGLALLVLLVVQRRGAEERAEREAFALESGTVRVAELVAPAEILRDERGIPHLIARHESEAWFALGFAHAQDRLAQMTWLRRRALGRTAEIDGAAALPADRLARLLEIGRASDAAVERLPRASREVLEAYARGVNARIARVRQGWARAPRALAEPPDALEAWRPADSLAVVKLLSWCMGGTLETTLVLDDLIQRLDSVSARPFFPGRASVDFGVAPRLPRAPAAESTPESSGSAGPPHGSTRALCRGIGLPTGGAWVVDGARSESGAPLVVADWHVAPSVPSLFYEMHLDAGALEVAGATIPGSPIVWTGRNPDFAWAAVPASAPIADLFIETLREARGLYQNGTLWVPLELREEVIRHRDGRGELQEEILRLRSTRHGPLIEALEGPVETGASRHRAGRALSWTGARAGDGLTSMLALLRVDKATEVAEVLAEHHEPVLAFAYADRRGRGGVQVAGWLPDRPLPTGLVPVQGRLRSFDWRERASLEKLPHQDLASDGPAWLLALDQPWHQRAGLDQMEWLWRSGDRAARLEAELERLLQAGPIDLRQAGELLGDDLAQRSPRVVAAILALARRDGPLPVEAEEVAGLLERWDGRLAATSAGAAAYHLVIEHLLDELLREPFGDGLYTRYLDAPHVRPQYAIERLVVRAATLRRSGGWTDEERVARAARASLRKSWISLSHRLGPSRSRWAWGRLHRLSLLPFGPAGTPRPGILRGQPAMGSGQTLAFASHRPGRSFEVESVGFYRIAMDLAAPDRLLSVLAPGQSEHPGHPHYLDGLVRWTAGRLPLLTTSRLAIEEESTSRLLLEPAP